jgi:putative thioredoxin
MATANPTTEPIVDVSDNDFETAVIARSRTVPVVVDFWAPWCGPCRTLGPTLERLAREMQGAFVLAKVNVDQSPMLSSRFKVQSIPMVTAFRDGEAVDTFMGALPESQVRAWLRTLIPSDADRLADEAARLAASTPEAAVEHYRAALAEDAAHEPSSLGLGRILVQQGDPEAIAVLKQIPQGSKSYAEAQALINLGDFLATPTSSDDGTSAARYAAAAARGREGAWDQALQLLLELVQRDRAYGEDAARRAMLASFALLGETDPLVAKYRRLLANALF